MFTTDPAQSYSYLSSGDVSYYNEDINMTLSASTLIETMVNATTDADPNLPIPNNTPLEDPPTWYRTLLLSGYLIIIVIGLPANALVLLVTLFCNSSNSAQNTINTYITNLASADLLYTFGAIFWAWTNYDKEWK